MTSLPSEAAGVESYFFPYTCTIPYIVAALFAKHHTPLFHSKMEQYLDKMTAKIPDSIIVSANILVNKSKVNDEIFRYVVSHITSKYERSKIMGMDAVFVNMVENYYITKMCPWVEEEQLEKIIERAEKISPNLIGKVAPEFIDVYGRHQ